MGKLLKISLVALVGLLLFGCDTKHKTPNPELIHDMLDQAALKTQDYHPNDREKSGMYVPPAGSIAVGKKPYKWGYDMERAARENKNPLGGKLTPEVLEKGRTYYSRFCLVCHGDKGDGKGPVAEKFNGAIKTLLSDKVKKWNDAEIYHVIVMGQGLMGSYASQMPDEEARWAVVNYVRSLQKTSGN